MRISDWSSDVCSSDLLAAFRERHPGIRVEPIVDNRLLSLSKREADIALRATRPAEGDLFGRKLAEVAWTIYGSPAYLERHGAPRGTAELGRHALIGWEEGTIRTKAADWPRSEERRGGKGWDRTCRCRGAQEY